MEIKINVILSADPILLAALQAIAIGKSTLVEPVASSNGEAEPKKQRAKKAEAVQPEAIKEEAPVEAPVETKPAETVLTMEDITKAAVPRSRAGHKDKIKAKIAELGYENLADMQPEHFGEFMAFLDTIKL